MHISIALLALIIITPTALATIIHVPDDQPTIQAGIDTASPGDTVLVACGTYYEQDVLMKSGVCLRSETGDADCVCIDAENGARVLRFEDCTDGTRIEGIEIYRGTDVGVSGGGAYAINSTLRFSHCRFKDNSQDHAVYGGGLFARASAIWMEDCEFVNNHGGEGFGMAIRAENFANPASQLHLIRCDFIDNGISVPEAAAVVYSDCSELYLEDCLFHLNRGGIWSSCIESSGDLLTITGCEFLNNESERYGAVVRAWNEEVIVENSRFIGNLGGESGMGGLHIASDNLTALVSGCVFAQNSGDWVSALLLAGEDHLVQNCTVVDNESANWLSSGSPISHHGPLTIDACILAYNRYGPDGRPVFTHGGALDVTCTDAYGNDDGDWIMELAPFDGVAGNILLDPLFCDWPSGNYTLEASSPCLPANNDCDVLIGAEEQGCDLTAVPPPTAVVALEQNFPNPFNPTTRIQFSLPDVSNVSLSIYDLSGRLVRVLVAERTYQAGSHNIIWNGKNDSGKSMSSGVYLYRLQANNHVETKKLTLLR